MEINTTTLFSSMWTNLNSLGAMVTVCSILLVFLTFLVITQVFKINIWGITHSICLGAGRVSGKLIGKKEISYHRSYTIGKYHKKCKTVKMYRLVNDLIIDLGLKKKGATPYAFLFVMFMGAFLCSIMTGILVFGSSLLGFLLTPIMFAFIFCINYTRANLAHDSRIESILVTENIISNNIRDGFEVAVRNNLGLIPLNIRQEYTDFLDNIKNNWHIRDALLDLNNNLGSAADDFTKKCIVFELEEEEGIVGMFQDVVEINNINMEMRTEMKRSFEEVNLQFIIGASMIVIFLVGVIVIFPVVANFYLHNIIGQLLMALDFLLIVSEFVFITYLRAKEL